MNTIARLLDSQEPKAIKAKIIIIILLTALAAHINTY